MLLDPETLMALLTEGLPADTLAKPATEADIAAACERLFGHIPQSAWSAALRLPPRASIRDLYSRAVETDRFRTACGRISASYAW